MTRSKRRPIVAGLLALLGAAVAVTSVAARQVFRAGTDTVWLAVTVTDAQGRPIAGLDRDDFQIFEDGTRQDISIFERDPQPIALSLLIDSSTSMEDTIGMAKEAAAGFTSTLGPRDAAQIIDFNSDTRIRQTFTHDSVALDKAIRAIRTGGSTSLYTALYIAISELTRERDKTPDERRRQAIIVLSDGEDTTSLKSYEDVAEVVKSSGVAIYAIGLREKPTGTVRRFNQGDFALRSFSQMTGGRLFSVEDPRQLPAIYMQIATELASQYFIGYNTRNLQRNGAWRQINVRVTRPETVVRTRSGYYGPTQSQ